VRIWVEAIFSFRERTVDRCNSNNETEPENRQISKTRV
jgi:hypothetical protein